MAGGRQGAADEAGPAEPEAAGASEGAAVADEVGATAAESLGAGLELAAAVAVASGAAAAPPVSFSAPGPCTALYTVEPFLICIKFASSGVACGAFRIEFDRLIQVGQG